MTARLVHRGPDAGGLVVRGPIALGHRRLSIIDLSEAANQPMADTSGAHWIVFNGEIYNFRDIRTELAALGVRFRTQSDTEVILEAYKRWDVACLARFNGMFAFALWDERRGRLFLARDRVGEKPLFYVQLSDEGLLFASEIKALRAHPQVADRIDPQALGHFLSLNYTLTGACIVEGIRKLPPAHFLLYERGRAPRLERYWDLAAHFRDKGRHRSEASATEELAALIDDAVRLRLVSDVPLGAFLSGGIDSSTIVAAMCRLRAPIMNTTFSIGFQEESYSEVETARGVARHLGVDHRDRVVNADMATALERIVYFADEPLADTSLIPVYYLAAFARDSVTVCLSGDGADEIFAGYETYVADKLRHATRWVPRWTARIMGRAVDALWPVNFDKVSLDYKVRQFLRGHGLSGGRAHCFWRTIFDDEEKRLLLRPEWRENVGEADPFPHFHAFFAEVEDCHYLDQSMYVDIKTWLVDDILVKVDRATMAHSLESRAPFLDHRLIEVAASLPVEWKLRGLRKKHLLKESQRRYLPGEVINRPKRGFNAPVSHWFNQHFAEVSRAVTTDSAFAEWFAPEAVERLWREHLAGRRDNGLKLFGLTCFGLWLKQLRENGPHSQVSVAGRGEQPDAAKLALRGGP